MKIICEMVKNTFKILVFTCIFKLGLNQIAFLVLRQLSLSRVSTWDLKLGLALMLLYVPPLYYFTKISLLEEFPDSLHSAALGMCLIMFADG